MRSPVTELLLMLAALAVLAGACAGSDGVEPATQNQGPQATAPAADTPEADTDPSDEAEPDVTGDGLFPTIVGATASTTDGETWRFDVTLSSEYDSPERYADAWRVLDADGNELGIRVLLHDHANEQPFTRSTSVAIPETVDVVYIEARDQRNGWNGERYEVVLER